MYILFSWMLLPSIDLMGQGGLITDYNSIRRNYIFFDAFDSNGNKWNLPQALLENGILIVSDRLNMIEPATFSIQSIDENKDFEIEVTAASTSGILPGQIHFNNFCWEISSSTGSSVYLNGSQIKYTGSKPDKNKFNKYTIRKSGSSCYYFIDEKMAGSSSFSRYTEAGKLRIGFSGKLNVDKITVSYLEKADPLLAKNEEELRGAIVTTSDNKETGIKPGGKFFSLIIGVSKYDEPKLYLENPEKDAQQIKDVLISRYLFKDSTTLLLLNPTRQKVISELYKLRKIIGTNDNLLIFYAGHGYWDKDAKQGYWWAKDAKGDDPSTWLSNSDLREQIRSIPAAHTLLISDACFSGGIFRTRSGEELMNATKDVQMLYKMPSRRAITSGTMTTVPDNSVFLQYLLKRLKDNNLAFISSQQLFDSFRAAVINNSSVVPQDGVIAETGDEGGDFIFILKKK